MIAWILSIALELIGIFQIVIGKNIELGFSLLLIGPLYDITFTIRSELEEINKTLKSFKNKEVI